MADRAAPTTIAPSGARGCRLHLRGAVCEWEGGWGGRVGGVGWLVFGAGVRGGSGGRAGQQLGGRGGGVEKAGGEGERVGGGRLPGGGRRGVKGEGPRLNVSKLG